MGLFTLWLTSIYTHSAQLIIAINILYYNNTHMHMLMEYYYAIVINQISLLVLINTLIMYITYNHV